MTISRLDGITLLALGALITPAGAAADSPPECMCAPDNTDEWTLPGGGAEHVPLNARILLKWDVGDGDIVARQFVSAQAVGNDAGTVITVDRTALDDGTVVLTPTDGLTSATTVIVTGPGGRSLTFDVAAADDTTSPTVDGVEVGARPYETCATDVRTTIRVTGMTDPGGLHTELLLELTITEDADSTTLRLPTTFSMMGTPANCHEDDGQTACNVQLGHSARRCLVPYPDANAGAQMGVSVRVVDLAGNASAPTATTSFQFETMESTFVYGSGGCGAVRGPTTSGLACVLLGMLMLLLAWRPSLR